MPNPKAKTKTSLAELLAQRPARNDWSNGRPGATSNGSRHNDDDEFPEYDPQAYESGNEDAEDDGPSPGGAFAILAGLSGSADAEDDEWTTVGSKQQKKKAPAPAPAPAPAAASSAAPRRPAASPAPAPGAIPALPSALLPRPIPAQGAGPGSSAGPSRAPYSVTQMPAPAPRTPRAQTHDSEGRPISDTYYRTFQKVFKNSSGDVCMRFHKTDVVMVRPNGDVFLTSGGFKTRTTYLTILEGLEPLGFTLTSSLGGEGRGEWTVTAPDGTRTLWHEEMTIAATGPADRVRGSRLLAAYGAGTGPPMTAPPPAAAAAAARAAGPGPSSAAAAAAAGAAAPRAPSAVPAPAPAPITGATWSYRSAAGAAAATPAPYAPHLRPPGAVGSPAAAPGPAPAPVPTARTAESLSGLRKVLDAALAIQRQDAVAAAAAAGHGGAAAGAAGADLDDDHACVACMAAPKTTMFIPCGHLVLCWPCAERELERTGACCICRDPVEQHVNMA